VFSLWEMDRAKLKFVVAEKIINFGFRAGLPQLSIA